MKSECRPGKGPLIEMCWDKAALKTKKEYGGDLSQGKLSVA